MNKPLRIGVVGVGRIGKIHSQNVMNNIPDAKLMAVSDINETCLNEFVQNLSDVKAVADYHEILNDPDIDAVLICSSTDTHAQISIEAAQAGKHIFCEKPIDYDINSVNQVLDEVKKAGVKFQVGFNRRFDHNFSKVREMIADGKIGDPHIVKITSRDPEPPSPEYAKSSGGMFMDMTIHDFDMARFLAGSDVTEVYTAAAVLVDPAIGVAGDVDTAVITLKFENGAIGVIDNSRKAVYGYDQRVEVFGSKGNITVSNDVPNSTVLSTSDGVYSQKPKYFFLERYKDSFTDEVKQFVDAVLNDKPVPVTGKDGLYPILIGMAARESAFTGLPVKVKY